VWDPGELLDINVDQLTRMFSLIPAYGFTPSGPVTTIQTTNTGTVEDLLHRRGSQPDLERDVVSTPPALGAKMQHPTSQVPRCAVR
jgi:hypothetical protein